MENYLFRVFSYVFEALFSIHFLWIWSLVWSLFIYLMLVVAMLYFLLRLSIFKQKKRLLSLA